MSHQCEYRMVRNYMAASLARTNDDLLKPVAEALAEHVDWIMNTATMVDGRLTQAKIVVAMLSDLLEAIDRVDAAGSWGELIPSDALAEVEASHWMHERDGRTPPAATRPD